MKRKHSDREENEYDFARVILAIEQNNQPMMNRIYREYHSPFFYFIRKKFPFLTKEEIGSVYNDSLAYICWRGQQGELSPDSRFSTFLFEVGIKKALSYIGKYKTDKVPVEVMDQLPDKGYTEAGIHSSDFRIILDIVLKMKEPCNTILSLTYQDVQLGMIATIVERTEDATKTKRSQCMKSLRKELERRKIKGDDIYDG